MSVVTVPLEPNVLSGEPDVCPNRGIVANKNAMLNKARFISETSSYKYV
jgi:hypothetical protein